MKFLTKYSTSDILTEDLTYKSNTDNSMLRLKLLYEQKNFCAYTEKYVAKIDSTDVEHFDPSKKDKDDYYNNYSTLRYANEQKIAKYNLYRNCVFFKDLFFQDEHGFNSRIVYKDYVYSPIDDADQDAKDLIDYLGFNDDYLFEERMRHIDRLKMTLGSFTDAEKITYFEKYKNDLSFITAIEFEFKLDLSDIIKD